MINENIKSECIGEVHEPSGYTIQLYVYQAIKLNLLIIKCRCRHVLPLFGISLVKQSSAASQAAPLYFFSNPRTRAFSLHFTLRCEVTRVGCDTLDISYIVVHKHDLHHGLCNSIGVFVINAIIYMCVYEFVDWLNFALCITIFVDQ